MNQKKAELARQVLDLAAMVDEGLEHIRQRYSEGHSPMDTVGLFADIVHAFAEIEAALREPLGTLSEQSDRTGKTDALREGLAWMASSYEGNSSLNPQATLLFPLLPRFGGWRRALEATLRAELMILSS